MKSKSGFTLVELLIVVVVIVILSTISVLAYVNVQQQADDSKREADITVLRRELEKYYDSNGEYPIGCIVATNCTQATGRYTALGRTAPPVITTTTTLAQLKAILPDIPDDFGDPQHKTTNAMNQGTTGVNVFSSGYYYMSQGIDNASRTDTFLSTPISSTSVVTTCAHNRTGSVPGTANADSYIAGYYAESQKKWLFWQGQRKETGLTSWNSSNTAACNTRN